MADKHHHPPAEEHPLHRPGADHEKSDIDVWAVARFAMALSALCVVAMALLFAFFRYLEWQNGGPLPAAGLNVKGGALPPAPRLQSAPAADLREMLAAQENLLHNYGWIDRQRGVVRLPIERAIALVAQRGLPARPAPGPSSGAAGVTVPEESGLGPIMIAPGGPLHSGLAGGDRPARGGQP